MSGSFEMEKSVVLISFPFSFFFSYKFRIVILCGCGVLGFFLGGFGCGFVFCVFWCGVFVVVLGLLDYFVFNGGGCV